MRDTRRTRVILGLLLVVALGLLTIDYRGGDSSPLQFLRGFGASVFGPLEQGTSAVLRPVAEIVGNIVGAPAARRRIRELEQENQRLREQVRAEQLNKDESAQLDRLLRLAGLGRYRVVAARVVGLRSGQGYEDTVTIDAGSRDGIRPAMTVVTGDGLVGRVTTVGPATATVLLASDRASSVGGRLEGSQEIGVVSGGTKGLSGLLRFQLLNANADLRPGQRIVTFGSQGGRPYVPGVPIGTVASVEKTPGALTRTALVRPFVSFTTLDVVGVVVAPPRTDPRDSVLPPPPTPTASASPSSSPRRSPSPSPTSTAGNQTAQGGR